MTTFQGDTATLAALDQTQQDRRLLRMSFPRNDAPPNALMLANRLDATESMSRDFRYEIEVLSDSAHIPLKEVTGKMVGIALVREDGKLRHFNGYVHEFSLVKTDGGFAFYRMVLRPWLADLRLRRDCATFQNMSTSELCKTIFSRYLKRRYMTRLVEDDPDVTMRIQHNESDHNHLHRRLEASGWHYWYEHAPDGHTLWLGDDTRQAAPIDGAAPDMAFHRHSGSLEDDGVAQWRPARRVGSGESIVGSFDFKSARAAQGERLSSNRQGAVPSYEVFEDMGAYGFNPGGNGGDALAQRRMEEHDARGQYFDAGGNDRRAQPGRWFTLSGHFSDAPRAGAGDADAAPDRVGERQYLILSVHHLASNNYQDGSAAPSSYTNTFTCVRKSLPWRPGRGFHSKDTRMHGVQTAVVVGPAGEEIHTDEYGRVKVQFHWDRAGKFDAASSAWVRVMTPWAGQGFGHISLPRVGDEVVVQFLDGNCDRPLIIGSVYNAARMPPWELPRHKTQSGVLSRSTVGGDAAQANALRFEDQLGKNGVQLGSSHGRSELNLGWLRQPNNAAGAEPRGEGAELRSDEHLALRAGKGLLLSAWNSAGARQLARGEYLALLEECIKLASSLGQYAAEHQALPLDNKEQEALQAALQRWEHGSNTSPRGQDGGAPVIAASAPAGISFATPKNIVSYAGANLDMVAQQHLQLTAGQRFNVNAGKGVSLFAHSEGIRAIAHNGKLILQSQHDDTAINSAKNVNITANDSKIVLMAKELHLVAEDGSFIKIGAGGITLGSNGDIRHKASSFPFSGPATMHTELPTFGGGAPDQQFIVKYGAHTDAAMVAANRQFEIDMSDGSTIKGVTDADGKTAILQRDAMHIADIRILKDNK
ncbi:type VI secretion system Vgr family protein [Janthinobacterium fluminis]|uniref:Type VI secretion system tip protein TssI/VgrG n=1 Tax=Janthinobacterium fluminis TaxID=2987524 RepID=A0ABT5JVC5_9BURK|nr:type VI secretion system Vgr family protein [Janthinobacterium fluminis]MDC8756676.1 type VI secretion system tip protein TssI/VgrG [Janthinobacterium fluminis]